MNRGARHAQIFHDEGDCLRFLGILQDLPTRFGILVHGYALMPNHFHLLLAAPAGNLSDGMQHLTGEFARRTNRRLGFDGPIFRGRFRNRVVQTDAYWAHLLAYLHLNPVAGSLVTHPEECPWTSHAAYAGLAMPPEWLDMDTFDVLFGGPAGYLDYVDGVRLGRVKPPADFDRANLWRAGTSEALLPGVEVGPGPIDEVLRAVCEVAGVGVGAALRPTRGRAGNPTRWLAAWALLRQAGLTLPEAGRVLGVQGPVVPRMVARLEARSRVDPRVAGWMEELAVGVG